MRGGWFVRCLLAVVAAAPSAAANEAFVRRAHEELAALTGIAERLPGSSSERAMLADAADGHWDEFDLLSAALLAQDSTAAARERAARALERHVARLRRMLASVPNGRRPEVLFGYLHEEMLDGGFAADCHAIERTLRTGEYNCLSGTVLYVGLAERCGVAARAVLGPSHVYAQAMIGGISQDIETTAPNWYGESPSRRKQLLAAAVGGDASARQTRAISTVELLAVVYYNRGVEAFARRDFAGSAASNLAALKLDPRNGPAADNLLAAVNNWALQAAKRGDAKTAAMLLERGRRVDPNRKDLKATARFISGR